MEHTQLDHQSPADARYRVQNHRAYMGTQSRVGRMLDQSALNQSDDSADHGVQHTCSVNVPTSLDMPCAAPSSCSVPAPANVQYCRSAPTQQ